MNADPVTIILIEDDAGHARLIEKNVRRAGVNNIMLPFTNGSDALAHLLGVDAGGSRVAHGPVLVLLDLNLPDMSGLDILGKLRSDEVLRGAPVIVLTTTDDRGEIQRCYELGCNVYITKPVDYESFAAAIRQLGLFLAVMKVPDPS